MNGDIILDGPFDEKRYSQACPRIVWVLKQDSSQWGADEKNYRQRFMGAFQEHQIQTSPTWRKLAYASYGLHNAGVEYDLLPDANFCAEHYMMQTAIVESAKELADTTFSDDVQVLDGFRRHEELVLRQIKDLAPDIVIVCMGGGLREIPEKIARMFGVESWQIRTGNCWGSLTSGGNKLLWSYHPSYPRIGDREFYQSICECAEGLLQY